MDLSAGARLNPISIVPMDMTNIAKMNECASEHGQRLRQLTVRQQTTKFLGGTLPMSAYGLDLPQDPLSSSMEGEVIEREEKEVIEKHDSDFDCNLSPPH